ncbi:MAG: adenylate/guanylate cyclase domain-containing protein [Myxococcales bacterium]
MGFLRHVEDTEPVTFLQRVFIPLLERLVAAVNSEARENILNADAGPTVRSRDWAIAFTDMQNFTSLMETFGQDGFTAINEYFRHSAAVVAEHGGDIFEHTGDGFIVTLAGEGKERRAFSAGVRIIQALERITETEEWRHLLPHPAWRDGTLRRIRTRIGIHKGVVTTGRIGNERVCRYGMIGEAANIASRLESANKQFGTWLLVTEDIAAHAPEELRPQTRRIDRVVVVGTKTPVSIFTYDFEPPARYAEFRQAFDAGVDRYVDGNWEAARDRLEAARTLWPEDPACAALLKRLEQLGTVAPADWPGAFKMAQK